MDYFFSPRSVAVIGASRNTKKVGHVIFRNFIEGSFKGKVYPINPRAQSLFGHECLPSVLKVKESIDLGIITVPAAITPLVLEQCGKKGIPSVIIITSGFSEIGNHDLEDKIKDILKKYNMRAIGVNCLGVYDPYSDVDTFFLPRYKLGRPGKGEVAFISQSGATGSVVMDWMSMKGYTVSKFISYGNATDIDEADLIEYLAQDPQTKVICAYFEGVREGRKFYNTAKKLSKKKPIIVLKGGTTEAGSKATMSHTGSLAGSPRIYSAAFKQAGVIQAEDLEQIFDYARTFSTQPKASGKRIQIITDGGGFGVLTSDWVIKNNMELAKMNPKTMKLLAKQLPNYVTLKNPMDLTGDADVGRYRLALDAAIQDPGVDMIIVIVLFQIPTLTAEVVDVIAEAKKKSNKPIVVISAGGSFTEVLKKSLEDFGVPTFSYPEKAVQSLKVLYEYSKN
jgi:acetyl coenzyme A synthetase (ADP forming)-like protein